MNHTNEQLQAKQLIKNSFLKFIQGNTLTSIGTIAFYQDPYEVSFTATESLFFEPGWELSYTKYDDLGIDPESIDFDLYEIITEIYQETKPLLEQLPLKAGFSFVMASDEEAASRISDLPEHRANDEVKIELESAHHNLLECIISTIKEIEDGNLFRIGLETAEEGGIRIKVDTRDDEEDTDYELEDFEDQKIIDSIKSMSSIPYQYAKENGIQHAWTFESMPPELVEESTQELKDNFNTLCRNIIADPEFKSCPKSEKVFICWGLFSEMQGPVYVYENAQLREMDYDTENEYELD